MAKVTQVLKVKNMLRTFQGFVMLKNSIFAFSFT